MLYFTPSVLRSLLKRKLARGYSESAFSIASSDAVWTGIFHDFRAGEEPVLRVQAAFGDIFLTNQRLQSSQVGEIDFASIDGVGEQQIRTPKDELDRVSLRLTDGRVVDLRVATSDNALYLWGVLLKVAFRAKQR